MRNIVEMIIINDGDDGNGKETGGRKDGEKRKQRK